CPRLYAPDCNAHAPSSSFFVHLGNGTDELYFSPHKEDSPDTVGSSAGGYETTIVADTGVVLRDTSFGSAHELTDNASVSTRSSSPEEDYLPPSLTLKQHKTLSRSHHTCLEMNKLKKPNMHAMLVVT
ncbi:hypothetical protein KAF25_004815, partial [Fusarium avenaceum]